MRPSGGTRSRSFAGWRTDHRIEGDMRVLELLEVPIVQASMAGGPSAVVVIKDSG